MVASLWWRPTCSGTYCITEHFVITQNLIITKPYDSQSIEISKENECPERLSYFVCVWQFQFWRSIQISIYAHISTLNIFFGNFDPLGHFPRIFQHTGVLLMVLEIVLRTLRADTLRSAHL